LIAIYGTAFVLGAASAIDALIQKETELDTPVNVFGMRIFDVAVKVRPIETAVSILILAAACLALTVLLRSVLRNRRDLLPSMWGTATFFCSALYDAVQGINSQDKPLTIPYGYAAFVMGVVMSLLTRYSALRLSLEDRATLLKQRSAELTRSYEELRTAQAEIVRKEQLAAVGELSAVIAHEVRNPLAIITNAVATLRREGLGDDDRQTLHGILEEESLRLNRLVGDLLVYTRPVRCDRQAVSAREIVDRALALTQGKTDLLVTLVEPQQADRIQADPMLIRQVFENLVNNAMQAMPNGGSLTVSVKPQTENDVTGVEVSFLDTGEGMDTAVRDRAFDPFFTTRATGTGLGLAIVARIVNAHGGRLQIISDEGAGTEVRVFLPHHGEPSTTRRSIPPDSIRASSLPPMPAELRRAMSTKKN
jgi:signal transduction histidine kinase